MLVQGNQLRASYPVVGPLPLSAKEGTPFVWLLGLEGVRPRLIIARTRVSRVKYSRVIQMCVVPSVVPCVAPCVVPPLLCWIYFLFFREVNHFPAMRFLVLLPVLFLVLFLFWTD